MGRRHQLDGRDLTRCITQEYNLSVSGGNEKSNYAFSGNYTDQTGIIKNLVMNVLLFVPTSEAM